VKPTVFAEVQNRIAVAREEIFWPVLSLIPYEDETTRSEWRTTTRTVCPDS
jgi:acyl-CoA reductase-like NAD-dependent aldehyde dehydrogenase